MSRVAVMAQSALMRQELADALRSTGHTVLGSVGTLASLQMLVRRAPPDLVVVEASLVDTSLRSALVAAGRLPLVVAEPAHGEGPNARHASAMAVVQAVQVQGRPPLAPARRVRSLPGRAPHPLVVIGSSTGGPQVLKSLLTGLPAHTPPIVVVQHMPAAQTPRLAARLDGLCAMMVREAAGGEVLAPGQVWIAPGNRHLRLRRDGAEVRLLVTDADKVNGHRPSVNVLFRSLVEVGPHGAMALLLTGMGADGAEGLLELRQGGAITLTQNEESSAVFGMPRVARDLGASQLEGSPEVLHRRILNYPSS